MGEILLDNLTISRLPFIMEYFEKNDIHLQNYLYSLILWDKIICVEEADFWRFSDRNRSRKYKIIFVTNRHDSDSIKRRSFTESFGNGFNTNINDIEIFLGINNVKIDTSEYRG